MINTFEFERIADEVGCSINWFVEEREYWAAYNPISREIDIWINGDESQVVQSFFHEIVHAIDPVCQRPENEVSDKEWIIAEVTAEFGAKFIVGDNYVDDGNIDFYQSEIPSEDVIEAIERAEFFAAKIEEII